MSEFVYLFRGGNMSGSAEEMERQMQKWVAWLKELGEKGHFKAGQPLERNGGKVVRDKGKTITDGPFAEAKDLVGGYMLIEAESLDQAVELSKACPGFNVGGYVEVRPVMAMERG